MTEEEEIKKKGYSARQIIRAVVLVSLLVLAIVVSIAIAELGMSKFFDVLVQW